MGGIELKAKYKGEDSICFKNGETYDVVDFNDDNGNLTSAVVDVGGVSVAVIPEHFEFTADKDVTNPEHYKSGGIETIDYIQAKTNLMEFEGFCKGNAIKYITREGMKGGNGDIEKAIWYLNKLLEVRK